MAGTKGLILLVSTYMGFYLLASGEWGVLVKQMAMMVAIVTDGRSFCKKESPTKAPSEWS